MKVRIFVSLISFMFILSACNNNQENVRSNKENTIDNTESFVNVITNDGATINPVKKSDSEMTESEKKEEPRYYESEDLVVALPLSPAYVNKTADELTDSDLIDILQNKLLPSDRIIQNMVCNGDYLERDFSSTYNSGDKRANYVLINNINNMKSLEKCMKIIFTDKYLQDIIYPKLFNSELPLFIEVDGKLYYNANTGGGIDYNPDFSRAKVVKKTSDSFEIEIPITHLISSEELYTFRVVNQGGKWKIDRDYWFDLHCST